MSDTTYDDAVVAFLAKGENFKFAVDISERLDAVKDKLHSDFWEALVGCLQERLKNHRPKPNWRWNFDQKEKMVGWDYGDEDNPYFSLKPELNQSQYFYPYIAKGKYFKYDQGRIYYGIQYSEEETKEDASLKGVKDLKAALPEGDDHNGD